MNCVKCGVLMEETAKFCGECGTPVAQANNQEQPPVQNLQQHQTHPMHIQHAGQPNQPYQPSPQQQQQQAQQMTAATMAGGQASQNEHAVKAKETSKQFFKFAGEALKSPMEASRNVNENDKINGLIANLLYAFLVPFFTYLTAKSIIPKNDPWGFNTGIELEVPFASTVIQPFFYILLFLTIFITVNLVAGKMMKANINFMSVMAKFGSLNIVPVAVIAFAVILSLLSMNIFSILVFYIGLGLFSVSNISLLFSINLTKNSKGGLDVFYGLILTNIVMVIFFIYMMFVVLENILGEIGLPLL